VILRSKYRRHAKVVLNSALLFDGSPIKYVEIPRMMVFGSVCFHILTGQPGEPPQVVTTFTDEDGKEYFRSDPVPIEPGNKFCFGPVCSECELMAQYSYEPDTDSIPKPPETPTEKPAPKEEPRTGTEPPKANRGSIPKVK